MNKKLITNMCCIFLLAGCSSFSYHTETESVDLHNSRGIQVRPMEAKVKVSDPIQGNAECTSILFGLFTNSSSTEAYGADINSQGNIPDYCAKEAVYDAVTTGGADLIVAPRYNVLKHRFFCLGDSCLYKKYSVSVTGYKGVYYDIKDMDDDITKEYYKSQIIEQ